MMYTVENEWLKVTASCEGAELQSIYDKEMDKEILWYGNEKFWNRRAPLLFPNVGKNHDGHCFYKGVCYETVQHGFARDSVFECVEQTENTLIFQLEDTDSTRSYFPFAFILKVTYKLIGRTLEVLWDVENKNDETMYFTIGGHPGFNVPILENTTRSDYKLLFKNHEALTYRLVYGTTGTADGKKTYHLPLKPYGTYMGCDVTEHMFDNDALIFDDSQIDFAGIGYPDGSPYVTMECNGFTNFGIWTKPNGPYICLEPWMGRCDDYGFKGDISEKPDVTALEPQKTFHQSYTVTIHKK